MTPTATKFRKSLESLRKLIAHPPEDSMDLRQAFYKFSSSAYADGHEILKDPTLVAQTILFVREANKYRGKARNAIIKDSNQALSMLAMGAARALNPLPKKQGELALDPPPKETAAIREAKTRIQESLYLLGEDALDLITTSGNRSTLVSKLKTESWHRLSMIIEAHAEADLPIQETAIETAKNNILPPRERTSAIEILSLLTGDAEPATEIVETLQSVLKETNDRDLAHSVLISQVDLGLISELGALTILDDSR